MSFRCHAEWRNIKCLLSSPYLNYHSKRSGRLFRIGLRRHPVNPAVCLEDNERTYLSTLLEQESFSFTVTSSFLFHFPFMVCSAFCSFQTTLSDFSDLLVALPNLLDHWCKAHLWLQRFLWVDKVALASYCCSDAIHPRCSNILINRTTKEWSAFLLLLLMGFSLSLSLSLSLSMSVLPSKGKEKHF